MVFGKVKGSKGMYKSLNILSVAGVYISVSNPDPLHLAGSTLIPAPDPDLLRFLFPDPLKKALIWIRVAQKQTKTM